MGKGIEVHGYHLSYINDRGRAEKLMKHRQGVMFSSDLNSVRRILETTWLHGDYSAARPFRHDFYCHPEIGGRFTTVALGLVGQDETKNIKVTSLALDDLRIVLDELGLPFNLEQVRDPNNSPLDL